MKRAHRILKKWTHRPARFVESSLRESAGIYADHWLGFSEVQLHQWLEHAPGSTTTK